jgi:hypothetical protein
MTPTIMRRLLLAAVSTLALAGTPTFAEPSPAPANAYLYFIWPQDGAHIKGTFWCRFGLRNMGIAPAGVRTPNTGHHHLFVDVSEPLEPGQPIPQDKKHLHFGAGQTEALIDLPPGSHTLQLVLGDADHVPFDPPVVSRVIHITIVPRDAPKVSQNAR